jgi:phosphoribosylformimino-5-aminoimidazole carboxamide ribotide isomerase
MILFPAIDLKDGNCVRLQKGEMNKSTVFNTSPASQAKEFVNAGCQWLHMVDLNGAFEGKPVNADAVESIIKELDGVPCQLGGGIRDMKTAERWLKRGVTRVIIGTAALKNPDFVKEACKEFANRIAVGIDARNGYVAVEGWAKTSNVKAVDLALKFEDDGVSAIIYTDINRDGVLSGPNLEETVKLAEKLSTPVIVSGGVSSIEDLKACKEKEAAGLQGVISGRAIYDGRIDLKEALWLMK